MSSFENSLTRKKTKRKTKVTIETITTITTIRKKMMTATQNEHANFATGTTWEGER
jgi:hypothetical protein